MCQAIYIKLTTKICYNKLHANVQCLDVSSNTCLLGGFWELYYKSTSGLLLVTNLSHDATYNEVIIALSATK